jgi:NADH-quinone oxidoreductase subunit N
MIDYLAISPALVLAATTLVALFVRSRVVSLLGLVLALAMVGVLALGGPRSTFCNGSCSYTVDGFTLVMQAIVLLSGVVVVLMAREAQLPREEFHFLMLASLTGAVTLVGGRDLMTLVVALEVVSLPVFALVALRREDARSAEAGLKMFLVSVVSTAVMLFGISLVYGATATLYLDRIAAALPVDGRMAPMALAGVVMVLVGFGFKIAVVPFHFWAPDTYEGAPVPVAAFLSVISKTAGFAGLILVLLKAFGPLAGSWGPMLAVLAALSMTIGNLVALRQRSAVRLLAWSSIAQAGYMLAPLGAIAGAPGRPAQLAGATISYVAIYAAMNLGTFAVVALVGRPALADYRGLVRERPFVGAALVFFLTCLAGLPPGLAGLFAKVAVFRAVIDGGYGWLAVIMAVNTVIGLYYYLTWIALAFGPRPQEAPVSRPAGFAIGLAAAATVSLSVLPQLVLGFTP